MKTQKTTLSLKDMTNLVTAYEAVRNLNIFLLGAVTVHAKNVGILGALDSVYDVIDSFVRGNIKNLTEEEIYNNLRHILDNDTITPQEKAEKLLAMN